MIASDRNSASDQDTSGLPRLVMRSSGGTRSAPAGNPFLPRELEETAAFEETPDSGDAAEPSRAPGGDVATRLIEGRLALWHHPQAVRSALRALHTEGLRFARTPAGAEWQRRLAGSDLARYGRFIWEAYGMNGALGAEVGLLPSAWLDALVAASKDPRLEEILADVVLYGVEDEFTTAGNGSPARDPRSD
jgi:hypothetical protein